MHLKSVITWRHQAGNGTVACIEYGADQTGTTRRFKTIVASPLTIREVDLSTFALQGQPSFKLCCRQTAPAALQPAAIRRGRPPRDLDGHGVREPAEVREAHICLRRPPDLGRPLNFRVACRRSLGQRLSQAFSERERARYATSQRLVPCIGQ